MWSIVVYVLVFWTSHEDDYNLKSCFLTLDFFDSACLEVWPGTLVHIEPWLHFIPDFYQNVKASYVTVYGNFKIYFAHLKALLFKKNCLYCFSCVPFFGILLSFLNMNIDFHRLARLWLFMFCRISCCMHSLNTAALNICASSSYFITKLKPGKLTISFFMCILKR